MITFIKGKLVQKTPTEVVLDVNGIGYLLFISLHTYTVLPEQGTLLRLHTYLHIKEDAHTLYGFFHTSERAIFKLLISVSGIGTATARTMLSSLSPSEIQQAIVSSDVPIIQSVKGIGLKTAQRLVIELKDKILKISDLPAFDTDVSHASASTVQDEVYNEASLALEALGFMPKSITKVLKQILKQGSSDISTEELIKLALKKI